MERKSDLQVLLEKKLIKCLLAFVLPMVLMAAALGYVGVYASHGLTTLTSDLNGQYISYLAYYRDAILDGNLSFYTFSKTLGGDFYGFAAYYLFSPFNLLLLLFPSQQITAAVYTIYLLKIGTAGLFFYILLGKKYGYYYKNLLFSLAYCFMAYNVAYQMHLMWLDAVVFLPLVILGIEMIWEKKSSCLYSAMLAITIVSCYYTGYMVCLFCGIYAFWKFIGEKEGFWEKCKKFVRFVFASIVGAGMSAVVLIPALQSLGGSKETSGLDFDITLSYNFNIQELVGKLFTNCFNNAQLENGLPNMYCGMLVMFLLCMYFFEKKILLRQKIASFLVLIILILSCYVTQLSIVWHGFAEPNGFKYRFSFVISCFFILMAARSFYQMEQESKWWKSYLPACVIMLVLSGIAIWQRDDYLRISSIVMDMGCIVLFACLLYLYQTKKNELKPLYLLIAGLIHVGCLYYNSCYYMEQLLYQERDLEGYIRQMEPILADIKQTEDGFYRIEKKFYHSNNDAMLFSIHSLSHFSSTEQKEKKEWMHRLGYTNCNNYWVYYDKGSTIAAESLLGVRFVLDKEQREDNNYILYGQEDGIDIFYNPYALSVGFLANDIGEIKETDVFDFQNQLYKKATNETADILKRVEDVNLSVGEGEESGHQGMTYNITMEKEGPLYGYFENGSDIQIYVNGKFIKEHLNSYGNGIVPLGYFQEGQVVQVEIIGSCDSLFAYQDMEVFESQIDKLQSQSLYLYEYDEDSMEGEVYSDGSSRYLVFSIPYEEQWQVKVDKKDVKTVKAYGGLLAVEVEAGTHAISLEYETKGFSYSLWISVGSIGLYLFMIVVFVLKKQRSRSYEISSISI